MCDNCRKYNPKDSVYFQCADAIEKVFTAELKCLHMFPRARQCVSAPATQLALCNYDVNLIKLLCVTSVCGASGANIEKLELFSCHSSTLNHLFTWVR
jgi:hypothetical protein